MIAGKPETIFKARDFEYLVEKHMGYEAAKYFREYAEKADEEVRSAIILHASSGYGGAG